MPRLLSLELTDNAEHGSLEFKETEMRGGQWMGYTRLGTLNATTDAAFIDTSKGKLPPPTRTLHLSVFDCIGEACPQLTALILVGLRITRIRHLETHPTRAHSLPMEHRHIPEHIMRHLHRQESQLSISREAYLRDRHRYMQLQQQYPHLSPLSYLGPFFPLLETLSFERCDVANEVLYDIVNKLNRRDDAYCDDTEGAQDTGANHDSHGAAALNPSRMLSSQHNANSILSTIVWVTIRYPFVGRSLRHDPKYHMVLSLLDRVGVRIQEEY